MAASLFRFVGGAARNMIVANVFGSFMLLIFMVLGGYILVRGTTLAPPFFLKKRRIIPPFYPFLKKRIISPFYPFKKKNNLTLFSIVLLFAAFS